MSNPWDFTAKPPKPREEAAKRTLMHGLAMIGAWHLKTASSGMQRRGVPDILGVYNGVPFAVELKRSAAEDATPLQRRELEEFAASGGLALIARGSQGARDALEVILGGELKESKWLEKVSPR